MPFRGAYLRLAPARRELVRSLIYPVPDPVAAVPRRPPDAAHRRRGADRADGADGGCARRLPPRDGQRREDLLDTLALARHLADARHWWQYGRHRVAPRRHARRFRAGRRSLRPRAAVQDVQPRVRRRSRAGAGARRAACRRLRRSPPPSGLCTCATRPRRLPPRRWRSPATSPIARTRRLGWRERSDRKPELRCGAMAGQHRRGSSRRLVRPVRLTENLGKCGVSVRLSQESDVTSALSGVENLFPAICGKAP